MKISISYLVSYFIWSLLVDTLATTTCPGLENEFGFDKCVFHTYLQSVITTNTNWLRLEKDCGHD